MVLQGQHRSEPLDVDHLDAAHQQADPVLQPVGLLQESLVAGQPLKELGGGLGQFSGSGISACGFESRGRKIDNISFGPLSSALMLQEVGRPALSLLHLIFMNK